MQREKTSGLGRGWCCRRKRYELLELVSEGSGQHRKKEKGGAVHPALPVGVRREREGWTLTMKSLKTERREADLNFVQKQEARPSDKDVTRRG